MQLHVRVNYCTVFISGGEGILNFKQTVTTNKGGVSGYALIARIHVRRNLTSGYCLTSVGVVVQCRNNAERYHCTLWLSVKQSTLLIFARFLSV